MVEHPVWDREVAGSSPAGWTIFGMTEIQGDLLEIKEGIIFHQVNCMGVTGGLAGALQRKWPAAFDFYRARCSHPLEMTLGTASLCRDGDVLLFHFFGQRAPGPNTDMVAVRKAFGASKAQLDAFVRMQLIPSMPTYFPYKMGCGLGGGNWDEYRAVIEKHFPNAIIVRKPGYD